MESTGPQPSRRARLARFLAWTLLALVVFGIAPGLTPVRHLLSWPLIVDADDPRGDAAYVMAGGLASEERLRAAADLYHMGFVPRIFILRDDDRSYFSFRDQRSMTRTEWMLSYLAWLGVPREKVTAITGPSEYVLGSLHEADLVREALPREVHRLVVVTSPVHTRRCGLAFRRRLRDRGIEVETRAAVDWATSAEAFAPLWLEYVKLLVYAVVA